MRNNFAYPILLLFGAGYNLSLMILEVIKPVYNFEVAGLYFLMTVAFILIFLTELMLRKAKEELEAQKIRHSDLKMLHEYRKKSYEKQLDDLHQDMKQQETIVKELLDGQDKVLKAKIKEVQKKDAEIAHYKELLSSKKRPASPRSRQGGEKTK